MDSTVYSEACLVEDMVNTLDTCDFQEEASNFANLLENNVVIVSKNEQKSRSLYAKYVSYNCSRVSECHSKCHSNVRGLCIL